VIQRFDAIVLAGGRARRLDGADKPQVMFQGRPLLDHVLDSVKGAGTVVVVGPDRLARPGVLTALEDPPFGGPAAGIAAGLSALDAAKDANAASAATVVVLACDMPRARECVPALLAALASDSHAAGAQMVTPDGRHQPLAGAYRRDALRAALASADGTRDASVHSVLKNMAIVTVADSGHWSRDVDTWEDLLSMDRPLEASP
jgi:molybdopterin-guanine dinucleotide biosynthesis protein A